MKEERLFHEALERPAEQRAEFVDAACGTNADMRHRMEVLLRAHENPGSFLNCPTQGAVVEATAAESVTEKVGTTIGPYKIREQLGEGGMGVVYVAEQKKPVRRKVALKIIKAGMDTDQVIARFEAERQTLAMLDHPGIARVIDAGSTKEGRPYFAMELIRGIPITDYCDSIEMTTPQRLALFASVCNAVQHAHQKGIIHRDLKPSNVMVTEIDGRPVAKVIDFGVAKATSGQLTEQTVYTQFSQMVGTPLYMSPEQAGLSGVDVDTRSDIYSLGVMLYQLLTGSTPFDKDTLSKAGFDEMRRIIKEEDPPRPSHRVSTLAAQGNSTETMRRLGEPRKLASSIRGELDWIVMKALEKDRNRRYETAGAFARDVQRYLDDEPVEASPHSTTYRLQKYARRHRKLLTTLSTFAVVMTVATAVSLWQASQANQQRLHADANFETALQAVDQMLTRVADESLLDVPQMTPVRMQLFDDAIGFYQELLTERPGDTRLQFKLAVVQFELATVARQIGDNEVSLSTAEASVKTLEQLVERHPMNPAYAGALAESLRITGEIRRWDLGDLDAMVSYNQRGAEIARRAGASMAYARSLAALGWGHNQRAEPVAAIETLKEAIPLLQSSFDDSTFKKERNLGFAYNTLGKAYRDLRDYPKAVDALQIAVTTHKKVLEFRPESLLAGQEQMYAMYGLASALRDSGDTESAITVYREGLEFSLKLEKQFPASRQCDTFIYYLVKDLRWLLQGAGKETEILSMIDGLAPVTSNDLTVRGVLHSSLGDTDSATADFNRAIEINPKNWAPTHELVAIHMQNDEGEKAVELNRTLLRIVPHARDPYCWRFDSQRLAAMQCRLGDLEEARRTLILGFEKSSRIDFAALMNSEDKSLSAQYLLAAERFLESNPTKLEAHALRSTIQAACGKKVDAEKSFASTYDIVDQLQWSDEMDSATKKDRIEACGILLDAFSLWNENDRSDLARKASDYSMKLASKLARQFPDDAEMEVVEKHAVHLYRNLAPKDAVAELSRLIDEMGDFSALYRYRGCEFRDIGRFDEALTDLDKAIELLSDDGNFETYESRGILFVEMKQCEKAIADFDKYVELSSNSGLAHFKRGEFYLNVVKNHEQAIIDFDFALAKMPSMGHWYKRRVLAHFHLDNYDEVLADIGKAIEINPNDNSNLTWISPSLVAACPNEAFQAGIIQLADHAVELNEGSADFLVVRAALLLALGDQKLARRDLDAAAALENASYYAMYQAALLALASDDGPRYRELCQRMMSKSESSDTNKEKGQGVVFDAFGSFRLSRGRPTREHGDRAPLKCWQHFAGIWASPSQNPQAIL